MRVRATAVGLYGLTLALLGCTGTSSGVQRVESTPREAAPTSVPAAASVAEQQVLATIVTPSEAVDVAELFARGLAQLEARDATAASGTFDRIVQHDPSGPFAGRALLQGGLAYEAASDLEGAALRFEQLARRFPEGPLASEALLRAMRVRLHLDQRLRAGLLAEVYSQRYPDAAPAGRLVASAARALAALERDRIEDAEYFVAAGLSLVDRLQLDRAGRIPRDVAIVYFARGETRRRQAEAATLTGDLTLFAARLERRCELLLSAQAAYSDSMRAHDAHWSTLAGYRVGELYGSLHRELMALPAPRADTERERLLFRGAMRLRYSVLLDKATVMLEHTLEMARREGQRSEWVQRSERLERELSEAAAEERRAIDRLPFGRGDLQRALDDLERRARAAAQGPVQPAAVKRASPDN